MLESKKIALKIIEEVEKKIPEGLRTDKEIGEKLKELLEWKTKLVKEGRTSVEIAGSGIAKTITTAIRKKFSESLVENFTEISEDDKNTDEDKPDNIN